MAEGPPRAPAEGPGCPRSQGFEYESARRALEAMDAD